MFKIDHTHTVLEQILYFNEQLRTTQEEIHSAEQKELAGVIAPEVESIQEAMKTLAKKLLRLQLILPQIPIQLSPVRQRVNSEVAQLQASFQQLQDRVILLTERHELFRRIHSLFLSSSQLTHMQKGALQVLNDQLVEVLTTESHRMPLALLEDTAFFKHKIDALLAKEYLDSLSKAFTSFFDVFDQAISLGDAGKPLIQSAIDNFPKELQDQVYKSTFEQPPLQPTSDFQEYQKDHILDNLDQLYDRVIEIQGKIFGEPCSESPFTIAPLSAKQEDYTPPSHEEVGKFQEATSNLDLLQSLIEHCTRIQDDISIKNDQLKILEILNPLFATYSPQFKTDIYYMISRQASQTGDSLEDYGKAHFTDIDALLNALIELFGIEQRGAAELQTLKTLIQEVNDIDRNPLFIREGKKRLEALHTLFNSAVSRDFKLFVYRAIADLVHHTDPATAEDCGRALFSDITAIKTVLSGYLKGKEEHCNRWQ
ncbi:MAG: hypothetical protein KGZ39_03840 [Simkania sp.]|nr:hypothetical protein [Simkania sp.]